MVNVVCNHYVNLRTNVRHKTGIYEGVGFIKLNTSNTKQETRNFKTPKIVYVSQSIGDDFIVCLMKFRGGVCQ